jgi:AraC-like DNA-binding protein
MPAGTDFSGSLDNLDLGDFHVSTVSSAAQTVRRTRDAIRKSSNDHFLLSLQTSGNGILFQDDRVAILRPGDFALYDSTRPYQLQFDDKFGQIVLQLPRQTVNERLMRADLLTAKRVDGRSGVGLLTSNFIRQLHEQIEAIDEMSSGRLKASAVDLLATALAEQSGGQANCSEGHAILRRRVCSYIDMHLSDHDLTCEKIAARHFISERQLRRIFEGSELSLSEWIWSRRLEQAKRDLADPLKAPLSVTAIAYDVGYKDSAHFSRAFKARFGISPRNWRRQNELSGQPWQNHAARN